MPLTPLHYPLAYLIYRVNRKLVLPGLIVGSMFPDIEVPILLIIFGLDGRSRLILHSLIGAITIGTLVSLAVTIYFYPFLISTFFPVKLIKAREKCRFSFSLIISCLLGNVSHVLLDYTNHNYNPLFWPLITPREISSSPVCYFLGGVERSTLIVQIILVTIFIIIFVDKFVNNRDKIWEELLIGSDFKRF